MTILNSQIDQRAGAGGGIRGIFLILVGILALSIVYSLIVISIGLFPVQLEGLLFVQLSFAATLLVAWMVLAIRPFDPFSPLSIILFVVALGGGLRAPYILAFQDTSEAAKYLLLGYSVADVSRNMGWYLVGVISLLAGYGITTSKIRIDLRSWSESVSVRRTSLFWNVLLYSAIGVFGLYAFIRVTGIDLSGGLLAASNKQAITFDTGDGTVYGAGYQTFVGQFFKYPFFLLCAGLALNVVPRTLFWKLVCVALGLASAAVPFLGNTRTAIVLIGLTLLIFLFYFGKLRLRTVLIWLLASLLVIGLLTQLRTENQRRDQRRETIADMFLGSGNGLDAIRTSLIIDLVPERVDYQYGQSLVAVFALAIPRQVWPQKPNSALGPWVKEQVFARNDVRNHGWPPGVIAEGHINFGYLGIILVPFLWGACLRVYYNSFRPFLGKSLMGTLVYAASVWSITFSSVSNNIALGIVAAIYDAGPLILLGMLVFRKTKPASSPGSLKKPAPAV